MLTTILSKDTNQNTNQDADKYDEQDSDQIDNQIAFRDTDKDFDNDDDKTIKYCQELKISLNRNTFSISCRSEIMVLLTN